MTLGSLIHVEAALNGRAAIIRLNRPDALNALNGPLLDALDAALDTIAANPHLRAVILTGGERCFSAGADLKEQLADRLERVRRVHALVLRLQAFAVPLIAAIEGWALGGGLELAMACTFRVAAPGARLGLPEVHLGAIPSFGGTQLSTRLLGTSRALELLCWGDPLDAAQGLAIGLVNWLAAEDGGALAMALQRAEGLAQRSPEAIGGMLAAVRQGSQLPLALALAIEESITASLIAQSEADAIKAAFTARTRTI
ncbi:enoyl-CoA hydratase/isomerase family protein [Novosphingobium rosa]|uniref:enoyl-CoA hydratase/isomerase family protein n=1 Tax=Novosphingobium rosa TaxID=76978 RepID=UPI00082CA1D3|nr:enoyl-CoA hydratase/isomerase family protein [Novosphingobium rosa]